jgi:uncharacterized protein with PIN domain
VDPDRQVLEVLARFDLRGQINAFHRCLDCNGAIEAVPKEQVAAQLEPLTRRYYDEFYRCMACGKIYWKGSHFTRMQALLRELEERSCETDSRG